MPRVTVGGDWLAARAASDPAVDAIEVHGRTWTFGALDRAVTQRAAELSRLGVGRGNRVGLAASASAEWVVTAHAVNRLKAVLCPVGVRLLPTERSEQLESVDPDAVICDLEREDVLQGMGESASIPDSQLQIARRLSAPLSSNRPDGPTPPLSILFTSGTTAAGKAVELDYGNHWWNAFGSALNLGVRRDDRWLLCMPPTHIGGLAILLRGLIYGNTVVLEPAFDLESVNYLIDTGAVSIVSLVPTMLSRLLDARGMRPFPETLRFILLGGGPIPLPLVETCLDVGAPIAPTYGLTETASQAATLHPALLRTHPTSAGKPLAGVELRINRLPGETSVGEILVRGPAVFKRYAAGDSGEMPFVDDGWFATGDLGELDDEGFLVVHDRRTDLIVTGGENVSPTEVEAAIRRHPNVMDAAVFGRGDAVWGQRVVAAVVPREDVAAIEDIPDFVRPLLAPHKRPKEFVTVRELPRTSSGKLKRQELAAELERNGEP